MGLGALLVVVGFVVTVSGGSDEVASITTPTSTARDSATTSTTSTSTTSTSTTTTTVPPETVAEFLTGLNVAFESSDAEFLLGRLNEATIERYGVEQCRAYLIGMLPQSQGLSLRRTVAVGPWDYVTDNVTTSLAAITAVEVDRVVNGEIRINELHWQLVGDVFTWFTDCGSPLIID